MFLGLSELTQVLTIMMMKTHGSCPPGIEQHGEATTQLCSLWCGIACTDLPAVFWRRCELIVQFTHVLVYSSVQCES